MNFVEQLLVIQNVEQRILEKLYLHYFPGLSDIPVKWYKTNEGRTRQISGPDLKQGTPGHSSHKMDVMSNTNRPYLLEFRSYLHMAGRRDGRSTQECGRCTFCRILEAVEVATEMINSTWIKVHVFYIKSAKVIQFYIQLLRFFSNNKYIK